MTASGNAGDIAGFPRVDGVTHRVTSTLEWTKSSLDERWGKEVSVDFHFYRTADVKKRLVEVGFEREEVIEREPYPEIEYQSRRAYIFARKQ